MNKFYRIIILLLILGFTACASSQQQLSTNYDEDKDIGLGGTGLLAVSDEDKDSGLGGTGILGVITGYGSIFVNGIEIEYDNETPFTIDGKAAAPQYLEIGDVVEVLASDSTDHTRAQIINLRHEVIGQVDSVEPDTFSFTINGQSVVQTIGAPMPKPGDTVAVSGFRVDTHTVIASRVTAAESGSVLLRTVSALPFSGKTSRWLVQAYVQDDSAVVQLDGATHTLAINSDDGERLSKAPAIRILQLRKRPSGQLDIMQVITPADVQQGRTDSFHGKARDGGLNKSAPKNIPGAGYGGGRGAGTGGGPGSGAGQKPGKHW